MTEHTTPTLDFKDPEETLVVTFDFTKDLDPGETISTPVTTVAIDNGGTDAAYLSVLSGSPTAAVGVVTQVVTLGVADVDYRLQCKVTTSASRVLVLAAILPVREA